MKQTNTPTKYASMLLHVYSLQHTVSKQTETVKTEKDILTKDIKVGISQDVAMLVAGVAL